MGTYVNPDNDGLAISREASFEGHLNAYNVTHLDMTAFREAAGVVDAITEAILSEIGEMTDCDDLFKSVAYSPRKWIRQVLSSFPAVVGTFIRGFSWPSYKDGIRRVSLL